VKQSRLRIVRVLILFWVLAAFCAVNFAQISVPKPKRVITLAPSLGELVADFLGNDLSRIVGVSEYTDYPPALKSFPSVGSYAQFSLEKVLSLKPDLVFATMDGNPRDTVLHLKELGVPVVIVKTESLGAIQESIRQVADALGMPEKGQQMAAQLQRGIDRLKADVGSSSPKVMLQIADQPLIVAGKKSFLNDALEILGAKNIYADSELPYPKPSFEDVLRKNPDVIIIAAMGDDATLFRAMATRWLEFKTLNAVKNHRVYLVQSDALLRPTLRILEGLSVLKKVIYEKK